MLERKLILFPFYGIKKLRLNLTWPCMIVNLPLLKRFLRVTNLHFEMRGLYWIMRRIFHEQLMIKKEVWWSNNLKSVIIKNILAIEVGLEDKTMIHTSHFHNLPNIYESKNMSISEFSWLDFAKLMCLDLIISCHQYFHMSNTYNMSKEIWSF